MNCKQISQLMIEYVDGSLDEFQTKAVEAHVISCTDCNSRLNQEKQLQHSLRSLSKTQIPESLYQNAFSQIAHKPRKNTFIYSGISTAIAASLAAWIMIAPVKQQVMPVAPEQAGIEIAVNSVENIRLSFEAPDNFQQVTLTLKLPEHVELSGYPGQRVLSWKTSLNSGPNILTLPVIAKGTGTAVVEAKISSQEKSKTFKIKMIAKPEKQKKQNHLLRT